MSEASIFISVVSVSIAALSFFVNTKRNKSADDRKEAAELTTVIVKLENISNDTREIKNELRSVRDEVGGLRERVIITEQSAKSLHKRVDSHEERLRDLEATIKMCMNQEG